MTYRRVLPRDLFNEAKLLKCLGQLCLLLHDNSRSGLSIDYDGDPFDMEQDPSNGSLYCPAIKLFGAGVEIHLFTPLNSKEAYPLYGLIGDSTYQVFGDKGELSAEFLEAVENISSEVENNGNY